MKYRRIVYEKKGNICKVTLNRPEALNAIDTRMARELLDVAERIGEDSELRAVVLDSEGARAFSVGQDIKELVRATDGIEDPPSLLEARKQLWNYNPWEAWALMPKPTIAAIRGCALGGGLELALACDLRIASEDATFGFPEVRLGIIPGRGGTQRLPRIIGRGRALEMILTGDAIDSAEAFRVQLISKVVPSADLTKIAEEMASRLAGHAPLALRFARETVARGLDMTFDQGMQLETDLYVLLQTTQDRAEGMRSFLEKRPPVFTGT